MKPLFTRLFFLISCFILLALPSQAQTDLSYGGAQPAALGQAFVGVRGEFWGLFYNPASISTVAQIEIGAYFERRFLINELNYGSAGIVIPFAGTQAVGLEASTFGFDLYRETQAGLSYGITFLEIFSIGVKANYANLNISENGSTDVFYVDAGLNVSITKDISLGFSAFNVNRAELESQTGLTQDIPTVFAAGLAYRPSDKVLVVADMNKDVDHPVSFRGGIEYYIIPELCARVGVSSEALNWSTGLGLKVAGLRLDVAFSNHEQLGFTPHVSLSYGFGNNAPEAE